MFGMAQATLDDDDLFGEAAEEVEEMVSKELAAARSALPDPDSLWTAEADNVLGVMNTLRTQLDIGEAGSHLREAKKWYTIGSRAGAFEEDDGIDEELAAVTATIDQIESLRESVGVVASGLPQLRDALSTSD